MSRPSTDPVLEARDLHVSLGGSPVLDGVDLRIAPGEMVALLGANGSGKSTLLRALLGLIPLASGEVTLLGSPARRRAGHDRLGYVPQDSASGGSIPATAREAVAAGLLGPRTWTVRRSDRRVQEALDAVGLGDLAGRPVTRMSGGQRRRVMIARALVRRPELLVLDEPFAGIDLPTQELIAGLFRDLSASGTTILVVLHETGALAEHLSRAVVLDHGRVVHDGPVSALPAQSHGDDHDDHSGPAGHIDECLGQEIHPA
ncbi:ATP-binding cassette domain-containing protein [Brachybacterium rhamnosum]|uniref:Metal ABC transporter ATP-binding protein n=1 Tax=Brachybacterium rhamnosum TaxID=173361 RepID=A0ABW4Q2F9_9MICO